MPKTHPTYDATFRQSAVDLLLSSGRPLKRVAADLGRSANSLRTWRDLALGKGGGALAATAQPPLGRSDAPFADPAALDPSPATRERISAPPTRDSKKSHEHSLGGPHEWPATISSLKGSFSNSELCDALGVSRSGCHAACSVNRVARVMRAAGLRVRARSPYRPKTTQVDHAAAPSPNLLVHADPPVAPGTHLGEQHDLYSR